MRWLAYTNFGFKFKGCFYPIKFLRRLQCNIFGHEWFTWVDTIDGGKYCAWCCRRTEIYPKMKARLLKEYYNGEGGR